MQRPARFVSAAVLVTMSLAGGLYLAELVFRHGVATPAVPRTSREFRQVVESSWPRPVSATPEPGVVRILGLADSFGVAGGADNYHYRVERLLRDRGLPVEMVNLSVPAYSPDDQWRLLRTFGPGFEPDIVLHGFFVGNDFGARMHDAMRYRGIDVELRSGLPSWYPQNLVLPRWLAKWRTAAAERRARDDEQAGGVEAGSFSRERFLHIERVRLSTCLVPKSDGPAWPGTVRLLDAIGAETQRMAATRVMVVHPDQFQIEPALLQEIVDTYRLDRSVYDFDLPQKFLHAYAGSRQVPLIDLMPEFRQVGSGGGLYLSRDTHYNDEGNRLAAARIADTLAPIVETILSRRAAVQALADLSAEGPAL